MECGCTRMFTGCAALLMLLSWALSMVPIGGNTQHLAQAVWYLLRSFSFEEQVRCTSYGDVDHVHPISWLDVVIFPMISLAWALPELDILDYVWLPLIVHLCMGYTTRTWYVVCNAACLCMALMFRPQISYICVNLLWGWYRGHRKWSLRVAALAHLCFCWTTFDLNLVSVVSGICAAEGKFLMMSNPFGELEILSYLSVFGFASWRADAIWSLMPTVSGFSIFGWNLTWRYTDKVWYDFDVIIFVGILVAAYVGKGML